MPSPDADAEFLLKLANSARLNGCGRRLRSIAARLEASRPVGVSERLPEPGSDIMLFQQPLDEEPDWTSGWFESGEFFSDAAAWRRIQRNERAVANHVTHWLPLPAPPTT